MNNSEKIKRSKSPMPKTAKRKKAEKAKSLHDRAWDYAWGRKPHTPNTWSEDETTAYQYGLEDGYTAGFRAALRAALEEKR